MTREFHWAMNLRPIAASFTDGSAKPITEPLVEMASGPAAYDDGGRYVVLEVLEDLEWIIADTEHNLRPERVGLDFREACNRAHDLNRADERHKRDMLT